ncbi:MAG: type II secretion system protein [Rickettsiales bacterium]
MHTKDAEYRGFTLIELAIILIVVGLITAGILIGRDMIRAAEVRTQVAEINKYDLAANTFIEKYNCLPGDCKNAVMLGVGTAGGTGGNGDGNNQVFGGANWGALILPNESIDFWYHLAKAGLIVGDYPGYTVGDPHIFYAGDYLPNPIIKNEHRASPTLIWGVSTGGWHALTIKAWEDSDEIGGRYDFTGLFEDKSSHYWYLGTSIVYPSPAAGVWLPRDAYAVDAKIDDGMPRTGKMRVFSGSPSGWPITGWDPAETPTQPTCVDKTVTPFAYNIQETTLNDTTYMNLLCAVLIRTTF